MRRTLPGELTLTVSIQDGQTEQAIQYIVGPNEPAEHVGQIVAYAVERAVRRQGPWGDDSPTVVRADAYARGFLAGAKHANELENPFLNADEIG